ncbi:MAG: UDP-N-acetylmuramoyl-L-alanyl-D-glutamate--2,6-diaminopimelate ligase [Rikenellaceae bacterium]
MKRLSELLRAVDIAQTHGSLDVDIQGLSYDSRAIAAGDIFFAVVGELSDGHNYIEQACDRGAAAILCERMPSTLREGVAYIKCASANEAMGLIAAEFYSHPSRELKIVGVTGTNGKTTTATLLYDLFRALGYEVGLISTVVYRIGTREIPSTHTTPDALRLQAMLREMVDCGCSYCFMEISSHALVQGRNVGLELAGALFTNLTRDHLDYHKTFAEYLRAKQSLFDSLSKESFALTNIDDRNGEIMLQNSRARKYSYSLRAMADFRARIIEMHLDGMLLKVDDNELWVNLLGRFNAYNLLAIYATAILLGQRGDETLLAMSSLHSPSGRFEYLRSESGVTAIIDYAHTPDALESVLETIAQLSSGSRVIVVCGCGGDRDRGKRPEMAAIAMKYAHRAIFTSDNPRGEDPTQIIAEMEAGVAGQMGRYLKIVDRAEAIRTAVMLAQSGDIVLIAGKGHEKYQIIGKERTHFDDKEVVGEIFKQIKG